jgi:hypothetical protein
MKEEVLSAIAQTLPPKEVFSREELCDSIRGIKPGYSDHSLSWVIYHLRAAGYLSKNGVDRYSGGNVEKRYRPQRESLMISSARELIKKKFGLARYVVFETSALNEWLNELIAHSTTLIEVERPFLESVFDALKDRFPKYSVLLNPDEKELWLYGGSETIVVTTLTLRSPLLSGNGMMSLEKLVVDLLADETLRSFISASEIPEMIFLMRKSYDFNETALFAYAKRRYVEKELAAVWK